MENRKATAIKKVEKILSSETLKPEQIETLTKFDRFNDLERGTSISTRLSYLTTLFKLGKSSKKPFEEMKKQDLKEFLSIVKSVEKESSFELCKAHLKRFFRWLYWHMKGEDGKLRNFKMPKCVDWIEARAKEFFEKMWKISTKLRTKTH